MSYSRSAFKNINGHSSKNGWHFKSSIQADDRELKAPPLACKICEHVSSYLNKISTHFNNSIVYHVHQLSANLRELCKDAFYWQNSFKSLFCKIFSYYKTPTNVHARYYLKTREIVHRSLGRVEE